MFIPNQTGPCRKQLSSLLNRRMCIRPVSKQTKYLEETLNEWMANTEQIDDILVIGVKV